MAAKDESMKQKESEETPTAGKETPPGNSEASQENEETLKCDSEKESDKESLSSPEEEAPSGPIVEELTAALSAEKDRVLRLSAEFENYKKRSAKEIADFRKFANETIFKQLLTVVDNLERAIASAATDGDEQDADKSSIVEGVAMTHKDILKLFESFSVKPVEAEGKPFDPAFHQAVTQQESDEHPDNTVITELQKGYLLHDRLIRPSMVVVSKAASKKE